MDDQITHPIDIHNLISRVLEGGLCAATVLVTFGVLIGKINPLQLLLLGLIETVLFVANCHVGYSMFGAVDVGMVGQDYLTSLCLFFGLTIVKVVRSLCTLLAPTLVWQSRL